MELRQLVYFTTLAETLNFRRAAERLNISQPPLTVSIRKLEEELGAPLFTRSSRGVALTAAGEAALQAARATLAEAAEVRLAARQGSAGERGRLRVGFVGSAIYGLLPRLIPAFRRRYPQVDLLLEEGTSVDIVRRLSARELDVGLIRLPLLEVAHLDIAVVERDELVVALPAGHALAHAERVPLSALSADPFILHTRVSVLHATVIRAAHHAGFVPQVAQEAAQVPTLLSLVRSGLGVALVPSLTARQAPEGVRMVRLMHPLPIEAGIVLPHEAPTRAALNFRALALEDSDSEQLSR